MGAEARQAARVQPAAARRRRYQLHRAARGSQRAAVGEIRHHARQRYAAAARDRPGNGRHAVAPLEPAALRPVGAARDRGLRHSPAARRGQHRQRQPLAVLADLLGPRRHRSVHDRGVRHLPGSLPRGQLRRQGHLRRRRVRAVARRARAGQLAAQPRSLRGVVRPRGAVHRHPRHRRLPGPLPELRHPPAPVGPRRLADCALDLAHGPRRPRRGRGQQAAGNRALEDPRQPAAQPDPAVAGRAADRGLDRPPGIAGAVDHPGADGDRVSRLHAARTLGHEPPGRGSAARAHPRRARQHPRRPPPGGAVDGHAGASERGDARCDRPDADPDAGDAPQPAAVGHIRSRRSYRRRWAGSSSACGWRRCSPWWPLRSWP